MAVETWDKRAAALHNLHVATSLSHAPKHSTFRLLLSWKSCYRHFLYCYTEL